METYCCYSTERNLIITLLLEVDVILFPEPGVGQVARIRLRLAGEECILGYVYGDVFWRWHNVWRPWEKRNSILVCVASSRWSPACLLLKSSFFWIDRALQSWRASSVYCTFQQLTRWKQQRRPSQGSLKGLIKSLQCYKAHRPFFAW